MSEIYWVLKARASTIPSDIPLERQATVDVLLLAVLGMMEPPK
jgi:hypothetical protein